MVGDVRNFGCNAVASDGVRIVGIAQLTGWLRGPTCALATTHLPRQPVSRTSLSARCAAST